MNKNNKNRKGKILYRNKNKKNNKVKYNQRRNGLAGLSRKMAYNYSTKVQAMGPGQFVLNIDRELRYDFSEPELISYYLNDILLNSEFIDYVDRYSLYKILAFQVAIYPDDNADNEPTYLNIDYFNKITANNIISSDKTKIIYNDWKRVPKFKFKPINVMMNTTVNPDNAAEYRNLRLFNTTENARYPGRLLVFTRANLKFRARFTARIVFKEPIAPTTTKIAPAKVEKYIEEIKIKKENLIINKKINLKIEGNKKEMKDEGVQVEIKPKMVDRATETSSAKIDISEYENSNAIISHNMKEFVKLNEFKNKINEIKKMEKIAEYNEWLFLEYKRKIEQLEEKNVDLILKIGDLDKDDIKRKILERYVGQKNTAMNENIQANFRMPHMQGAYFDLLLLLTYAKDPTLTVVKEGMDSGWQNIKNYIKNRIDKGDNDDIVFFKATQQYPNLIYYMKEKKCDREELFKLLRKEKNEEPNAKQKKKLKQKQKYNPLHPKFG